MSSVTTQAVVVSAEQLAARLRAGEKTVVLEIHRGATAEYASGHLPGARLVRFEEDLVGARTDASGNAPLPDPAALQERLHRWGVDDDSTVVVYSRQSPAVATRAWWTLRWAGIQRVHYLNGGIAAWERIGGRLDTDLPALAAGTAVVRPGALPVLSAEDAARIASAGHLIDARGTAAYLGDPQQLRVGHIPGAHSVPGGDNFVDGELLDPAALTSRYADYLDGREIGVYCGSGVSATTTVLALAQLGVEVALYPGSWSAWTTDPSRPTATGVEPGSYQTPRG
jgi:thiosulfate/3-mercaptopyruvate sulfurtransferase